MNILFQVGSWHYDKGGTDLFVKTLAKWLARKGHKVVVLVHRLKEEKCNDEDISIGRGKILVRYTPPQKKGARFNILRYAFRLILTSYMLYRLSKIEQIDAVIVGETELLAVLPLKLLNLKILCRGGALMYETMSKEVIKERGGGLYSRLFIQIIRLYNRFSLKLPDILVPVNKSEYDFLKRHKKSNAKIITIPHGVPIELFKPKKKKRGNVTVGYVGRLAPIKDPGAALKIFKKASKGIPKTEFVWVGPLDPSFKKRYFEDLKEQQGVKNAKYLGKVQNEELPKTLNKMDIFLQVEQQKNVSRSTTEAAACGLPIVALNQGSEPFGFFTMSEEEAIKELRKLILDKRYREEKGKKARKIIEKDYSEEVVYQRYLNLIKARDY